MSEIELLKAVVPPPRALTTIDKLKAQPFILYFLSN
jgi:hypothetical protein